MYVYETWARANLQVVKENAEEWRVRCPSPSHDDDNPSADFNVRKGVGLCRSCGYKWGAGEVTDINLKIKSAMDRVKQLTSPDEAAFVPAPEDTLDRYAIPHEYWNQRKISKEMQELFQLGYDTQANAVTIPMRTIRGGLIGVCRRFLAENHEGSRYKYPYKFRASKNLFASWLYEDYDMRSVVITEGAIDAMRWWSIGQPAVAIYGSTISEHQVRLMQQMGVRKAIYFGDSDAAGIRSKQRAHGWWHQVGGSYQYKPETDMSKHFLLYHVPYHDEEQHEGWPKDAGSMSDDLLRKCLSDIELYQFEPPKYEKRDKTYISKSRLRALIQQARAV